MIRDWIEPDRRLPLRPTCAVDHSHAYHITLQAIKSGLSRSNFKDHYDEAVKEQCLDMIAEIDEFLVYDEML